MKKIISGMLVALLITSCSVSTRTKTGKTLDITSSGIAHFPLDADLVIKETKVTGTANSSRTSLTAEAVKQDAVANALRSADADVLIEPRYEVESRSGKITVTVTGYPASYTNFQARTEIYLDGPVMSETVQESTVTETQDALKQAKAKKFLRVYFGTLAVAGLILGLVFAGGGGA